MFFYKLKKYVEGVGFIQRDIQDTISASYNKVENEYGQFEVITNIKTNNYYNIEIDDFIELWAGDKRLATGFAVEISYNKDKATVTCLTEEYKLEKILLPSDYTINTAGLNLNNLADFLRRRYWQVRWNQEYDFEDVNKITYKDDDIRISSYGIHQISTYIPSASSTRWYSHQLEEYYEETGKRTTNAGTFTYDKVAITNIHNEYFLEHSVSVIDVNKTRYVDHYTADNFLDSKVKLIAYPNPILPDYLEFSNYKTNGVTMTSGNEIIRDYEVVKGKNTKIKWFLNSQGTNYEYFERSLFYSWFRVGIEEGYPQPPEIGISLYPYGVYHNPHESRVSGWLNLSTEDYEGYKLDRVRYAETYVSLEDTDLRYGATNTFLGKFADTYGVYDSANLPTNRETSTYYLDYKFPNENTEKAGVLIGGNNTTGQDFYFSFLCNITNMNRPKWDDDLDQEPRYDEKFLWNLNIKGIEFVLYKNYVADYEVDSSIQNLYATTFEVDKNTNYEVLQNICSELNVFFYVEDDKLYIKDKSTISSSIYNFKEDVNCMVTNHTVNNENSYNLYIVEGQGDSPISKPIVNPRVTPPFEEVNKSKYLEVNYEDKQKLMDDILNDKIIQFNGLTEKYENKTVKLELEVIDNANIIKVGDKINVTTKYPVKSYKDIFVQEVSYQQKGELLLQKIIAGNSNKKLT